MVYEAKKLVPDTLFDENEIKKILSNYISDGTDYYKAILQNLFFATLTTEISKRDYIADKPGKNKDYGNQFVYRYDKLFKNSRGSLEELFGEVPYVNGGLFECKDVVFHDHDEKGNYTGERTERKKKGWPTEYRIDCFSKEPEKQPKVPNNLFFAEDTGLFDIFKRYNFTVDESTVNDQDISLDPEMLGRIFENLLGETDPDTQETARKNTGSFYTPREIVDYMSAEALIAYLLQKINIEEEAVRELFEGKEDKPYKAEKDFEKITKALYNVRICDPACGSGAFPMGILHKITEVLDITSHTDDRYTRKREIIAKCIFGIDLQPIAVEITMLRCFLSLLIEQQPTKDKDDNYGIKPLPSLDFKFIQGNSLVDMANAANANKNLFNYKDSDDLSELIDRFNKEDNPSVKKQIKQKINKQLYAIDGNKEENPNKIMDFVLWEVYFKKTDNIFDIVIGNPPYIQLQKNGGALGNQYKDKGYEVFEQTGDIYCLFQEMGYNKSRSIVCYITSNKWMRTKYGAKLRSFLAEKTNPRLLVDLGPGVFDGATVDTDILLFEKGQNQHNTLACTLKGKEVSSYVKEHGAACSFGASVPGQYYLPIPQKSKP